MAQDVCLLSLVFITQGFFTQQYFKRSPRPCSRPWQVPILRGGARDPTSYVSHVTPRYRSEGW